MTKEEYERMLRLFDNGTNVTQLATVFGISQGSVVRLLLNSGRTPTRKAELASGMIAEGVPLEEIAHRLKTSVKTIKCKYTSYERTPYVLDDKSENAIRIKRWRGKKKAEEAENVFCLPSNRE